MQSVLRITDIYLVLVLLPFIWKVKVLVAQSCLALCHPVGSPPGSSVHGILQARILECVAMPSPGDPPDPAIKPKSPNWEILYHLSHQGSLLYSYLSKPWASQVALVVKNLPASAGDIRGAGSIPGWERCPGEGHGNSLQYSCLKNPKNRGGWWATVHGVRKSQMQLSSQAHSFLG